MSTGAPPPCALPPPSAPCQGPRIPHALETDDFNASKFATKLWAKNNGALDAAKDILDSQCAVADLGLKTGAARFLAAFFADDGQVAAATLGARADLVLALAREHQQVVPLLAKADLDAATAGKLREYAHACLHGVAVAVETAAWEMDTIPNEVQEEALKLANEVICFDGPSHFKAQNKIFKPKPTPFSLSLSFLSQSLP